MLDPYLLPNGTLRNKLGIIDQGKLTAAEADLAAIMERQLRLALPQPPFTFDTLKHIHKMLFSDIYDWAGQPRVTELSRLDYEDPDGRPTRFTPPQEIAAEADRIFTVLQGEDLSQLTPPAFATRAARLLVEVNNLHWAREGNGRAQRLLLVAVGRSIGKKISFDASTRERMVRCSIAGSRGDLGPMERLFHDICDPERTDALRAVLRALRSTSGLATWNDLYIATTVAGRDYSGLFVGEAQGKFMMRVSEGGEDWIAIGDRSDLPGDVASGQQVSFRAARFSNQPPMSRPARTQIRRS